jgi:alpha-2-macroglobulin
VVERRVQTESENGFYSFKTKTSNDAPTGNWQAEVKVGNATFTKRMKIETVKPNRLKVELGLPKTVLHRKQKVFRLNRHGCMVHRHVR